MGWAVSFVFDGNSWTIFVESLFIEYGFSFIIGGIWTKSSKSSITVFSTLRWRKDVDDEWQLSLSSKIRGKT